MLTNDENTPSSARAASRKPLVVGIAGGSGSGKTTFADRLSRRLGADAVALSHDDYYKHLPHMTDEEAANYDFDSPDALDTNLLVEHLAQLVNGQAVDVPSYDFAGHARTEAARHVEPAAFIIVEGILIMYDPALRALFDLTVFVDPAPDIRALRRVMRDCQERGASLERSVHMYLSTTRPAHERYVEPFKSDADIVIADAQDDEALEFVVAKLESLSEGLQ